MYYLNKRGYNIIVTAKAVIRRVKTVRRRSKMSNSLKEEIAKELGVYDVVKQSGGWGDVTSRDCGNMVSKAIEIAEKSISDKQS